MYRLDLHTHSTASPDGGLSEKQYERALASKLDVVAITDHNQVDFALAMHARLGKRIIVGEEIMTQQGEVIGLFLTEKVEPNQDIQSTIQDIQKQHGLVYIPHPFETVRKGISEECLDSITDYVDIIEGFNGRAVFQNRSKLALKKAQEYGFAIAASSDAHGVAGLGTHTVIKDFPTSKNLVSQLNQSTHALRRPSLRGMLYPKYHLVKKFKKGKKT